ncbi:MAG: radical SAM protein [Candidatus Susulua stagnicola]|nr:radical SAM protein [Candidatus Susulua stagnicola]
MNILAINPWIVDFAAYDFWLKPYGFLALLTYLKNKGLNISYIDCLNNKITNANFGRGKYYSEIIEKPLALKSVPRYFKRYGITLDQFREYIANKNPDYILITSSMTYWYPGIIDAVNILKKEFPKVKIILGGTYATLLPKHAKKTTGCDFIFENYLLEDFFKLLKVKLNLEELLSTFPSYNEFYPTLDYIVLRTSWGCPFECDFCAIKKTSFKFFRLNIQSVINFILKYHHQGIKDFVLYDDAFLYEPNYAKELLRKIDNLNLNLNFHTPNALHLRFLDKEIANLLKKTGFINPHFGLETLNPKLQKLWGDKVKKDDLIKGANWLRQAGFRNGEFSAYLLLGYPNQNLNELKSDVDFLNSLGARAALAEFSPTPQTKIFQEYKEDLNEPLLHNNSIFGFFQKEKIKDFWKIKNYTRESNKKLNP